MQVTLARAVALALVAGAALAGVSASPAAAADALCSSVTSDTPRSDTRRPSPPMLQLGVRRAQQIVDRDAPGGQPVRVAVLDSGVYGAVGQGGPMTIAARTSVTGSGELSFYHGTAVAGLIAGHPRPVGALVGVAPDAEIVDVRVYDSDQADDGSKTVTSASVASGLRWVAANASRLNIRIANVSIAVPKSSDLQSAVKAAQRAGVVVVAASGNRPGDGQAFADDFKDDSAALDEDAAKTIFPAGYDGVVAANSTIDGDEGSTLTQYVLKNSRTDVAAPTFNAVSYGINGASCVIQPVGTSWAAAIVSGTLALLAQRFPADTSAQLVARLINTASGTTDDPTPLTGAGVVQPVEALTRPLDPARNGSVDQADVREGDHTRASAPAPETDVLAPTRDDAIWWGLIGGGVLVVALLLRPVLSRRRH
jgi:membrane-anchored mycosin MYCP